MSSQVPISGADVSRLIAELGRQQFFGHIQVEIRAGRIVCLHKFETFKTPQEVSGTGASAQPPAYDESFNK